MISIVLLVSAGWVEQAAYFLLFILILGSIFSSNDGDGKTIQIFKGILFIMFLFGGIYMWYYLSSDHISSRKREIMDLEKEFIDKEDSLMNNDILDCLIVTYKYDSIDVRKLVAKRGLRKLILNANIRQKNNLITHYEEWIIKEYANRRIKDLESRLSKVIEYSCNNNCDYRIMKIAEYALSLPDINSDSINIQEENLILYVDSIVVLTSEKMLFIMEYNEKRLHDRLISAYEAAMLNEYDRTIQNITINKNLGVYYKSFNKLYRLVEIGTYALNLEDTLFKDDETAVDFDSILTGVPGRYTE